MDNETLQAMRELLQEQKQELKQEFGQMMDERLKAERVHTSQIIDEKLKPIYEKLDTIQENVEINRHTGNLLLKRAEKAEHSVKVGLYEN